MTTMPGTMQQIRRQRTVRRVWLLIVLALPAAVCLITAAPRPASAADSASGPVAVEVFDRGTVTRMLWHIEEGHNSTLLKLGYFGSHRADDFPKDAGMQLLMGATDEADTGSPSWFRLKSLEAYAFFRMGEDWRQSAYDAYGEIFDRAAQGDDAVDLTEQAMFDLAETLPGMYGPRHFHSDAGPAAIALLKALTLQLAFIKSGKGVRIGIPWADATSEVFGSAQFPKLMDSALNDPEMPRTFDLLMAAASVYRYSDPARAAALVEEARQKASPDDVARLSPTAEVDVLVAAGKWKDAAAAQDAIVHRTGKGRGRLAWMDLKAGDRKSFEREVETLKARDADEADILQLAAILNQMRDDDPASPPGRSDIPIALLSTYLRAQRECTPYYEVNARLLLANLYLSAGRAADARTTIESGKLPASAPRTVALHWEQESKRLLSVLGVVPTIPETTPKAGDSGHKEMKP